MKKVLLCSLVLILSFTGNVAATSITNNFGLSSPAITITFDEFSIPTNTVITNQYDTLGVNFSPNLFQGIDNASPNMSGGAMINYINPVAPFSILFNADQTEAAFAMVTNPTSTTFSAYLDGAFVESFSSATDGVGTNNYYGFTGIIFDEIGVNVGGDHIMVLDSLQFHNNSPIPEPATMLLFGLGLLGLAGVNRRKK